VAQLDYLLAVQGWPGRAIELIQGATPVSMLSHDFEPLGEVDHSVPCLHCGSRIISLQTLPREYFEGQRPTCPACGKPVDWWDVFVRTLREEQWPFNLFGLVGAHTSSLTTVLHPDSLTSLALHGNLIPEDGRILHVTYQVLTGGGLVPIEMHGTEPRFRKYEDNLNLYPVPLQVYLPQLPKQDTEISVIVTWVSTDAPTEWSSLIQAVDALVIERFSEMVVPANVAVESKLTALLTAFLEDSVGISRDRVRTFLSDAATYSHQLNVMLPTFAKLTGAPPLSDRILGQLNRLRRLRNELGHRGRLSRPLDKKSAAELLAASLLAFHYLSVIEPWLRGASEDQGS
jgi:hypothetical protein